MLIYKSFFKIVRKYKISLIMYAAIMVFMLIALVGIGSSGSDNAVTEQKYTLLIEDKDQSEISKEFVKYIRTKHNIKDGEYSDEKIKDMLYYQAISEYIVIPEGFGDEFAKLVESGSADEESFAGSLLQATYDESLPRGVFINMQIDQYFNAVRDYMTSGYSLKDASSKTAEALDTSKFVSMQKKETVTSERIYTAFTFLPYGILSIIFSGVLPVVMSFNEKERKNRTIISSYKLTSRNVAIALGTATVSILVTTLLIGIASISNNGAFIFTDAWWLAVINAFIYTIVTVMLLSMITSLPLGIKANGTANTNAFVTVIIGLSFAFLGGTFVDLTMLGEGVAKIGRFTPNYWYSMASRKIWYESAGINELLGCFGLELLFGVVCLSIGLVFTKFFDNKAA